jgi:hypothetical protein
LESGAQGSNVVGVKGSPFNVVVSRTMARVVSNSVSSIGSESASESAWATMPWVAGDKWSASAILPHLLVTRYWASCSMRSLSWGSREVVSVPIAVAALELLIVASLLRTFEWLAGEVTEFVGATFMLLVRSSGCSLAGLTMLTPAITHGKNIRKTTLEKASRDLEFFGLTGIKAFP